MGRSHDVLISEFDLDRLEADLAAAERAAAEQTTRANENHAWALRAERERDEAREEIESIKKLLLDPNAVRINMLHGKIAKLDWEKLEHVHGNHPAREQLAAERALADRLAGALQPLAWLSGIETPNTAEAALAAWKEARHD